MAIVPLVGEGAQLYEGSYAAGFMCARFTGARVRGVASEGGVLAVLLIV